MEINNLTSRYLFFEKGWDGYEAEPPDVLSVNRANLFLALIEKTVDIDKCRVKPSVIGGIGITFKLDDTKQLYIEFPNIGTGSMLFSDTNNEYMETYSKKSVCFLSDKFKEYIKKYVQYS